MQNNNCKMIFPSEPKSTIAVTLISCTMLLSLAVTPKCGNDISEKWTSLTNTIEITKSRDSGYILKNEINTYNNNTITLGGVCVMNTYDLNENIETLESFLTLPENWNDNGAMPPSKELVNKMKGIVSVLPIQPEIFLTARDSIQFQYEKDNGDYLEFELFEDGKLGMFKIDSNNNEENKTIKADIEFIIKVVDEFYES